MELLEPSQKRTRCLPLPAQGRGVLLVGAGGHRVARDAAWGYPDPILPARFLAGYLCCFHEHERVELEVDGEPQARPRTPGPARTGMNGERRKVSWGCSASRRPWWPWSGRKHGSA